MGLEAPAVYKRFRGQLDAGFAAKITAKEIYCFLGGKYQVVSSFNRSGGSLTVFIDGSWVEVPPTFYVKEAPGPVPPTLLARVRERIGRLLNS